jgi:hypothetical protein
MDAVCESDAFLATVFLQACHVTSTQRNVVLTVLTLFAEDAAGPSNSAAYVHRQREEVCVARQVQCVPQIIL